jgi:uncharacterized protein
LTAFGTIVHHAPVNVEKLNSLSTEALYALAEKLGMDLPPDLDRVFVVETLVEALEEDHEDRRVDRDAPVHIEEKKFSGSELDDFDASLDAAPCIESRYNETAIRVLVRDPTWAFAFWDVKDDDRDAYEATEEFGGFFLRIIEGAGVEGNEYFDVSVGRDDAQWYLNLPNQDARYRIDLCVRIEGRTKVLARSNVVRTPRAALMEGIEALAGSGAELLKLSGIHSLHIEPEAGRHPSRILNGGD